MAITDKNTIYSWFQTDAFPTEAQFKATWDSFWHKSEFIPISRILGLNELFQQTVTITYLNSYIKKDLSNLSENEITNLKNILVKNENFQSWLKEPIQSLEEQLMIEDWTI